MSGWQSIDTAPKDGTLIIGWDKDKPIPFICRFVIETDDYPQWWAVIDENDETVCVGTPTHWTPMLRPPAR